MELGAFSISLTVKDLASARAFYETLGFRRIDGDDETWVVLDSAGTKIGLFQGMFDQNMLTFNPPDARKVERAIADAGFEVVAPTEGDTGPAHFIATDPDGNTILFDQH